MNGIFRSFIRYVSFSVMAMVGLSCYILADTFFISKALGASGLAALNFCLCAFSVMMGLGLMLGVGGGVRFSVSLSKGEEEKCRESFSTALFFAFLFSLVFIALGLFCSRPLAALLGASGEALPLAEVYLRTVLLFGPAFVFNNTLGAFVRNDFDPSLASCATIISSLSNIVLDYVFMFPLKMGMFGAAFATGLSPLISISVLSVHFFRKKCRLSFSFKSIKPLRLFYIMSPGISSFINELSSGIVILVFNFLILALERNTGVAAYGVVANTAIVATAIFNGIAQGMQPLVSSSFGRGDEQAVKTYRKYAFTLSLISAAVIYAVIFVFAAPVTAIFNSEGNAALAVLAYTGLRIYFAGFFFSGINICSSVYLSALGRSAASFAVSVLRSLVIIVPAAFVLSHLLKMTGIWLSFPVTELLVLFVSLFLAFAPVKKAE